MVETIKKIILNDPYEKEVESDFKSFLSNSEKQRLSGWTTDILPIIYSQ